MAAEDSVSSPFRFPPPFYTSLTEKLLAERHAEQMHKMVLCIPRIFVLHIISVWHFVVEPSAMLLVSQTLGMRKLISLSYGMGCMNMDEKKQPAWKLHRLRG